ncbi:hypothetical protein J2X04_002855 [Lysobacter niabensis]|uniref:Uncharacterized protein n=1 Tax=Agrilutibacter niabensis TaxID=380628 RepID=A0ABU1VSK7_9GAMM|nr:hypothetical protein [Lysobacter niabensis]MDR7100474.1 hypothetical protein [Lysobacter niabensis]
MFTTNPVRASRHVSDRLRTTTLSAAVAASMFAFLAMPASAGTTQVSGIGVFNTACQPPAGSPPANLGDYPPIELSGGGLDGCWYTYVSASRFNPSGTYVEQGSEVFVGCLNGTSCGTFETTYTFTAKYTDDTFAEEIHGRCHHPIVDGTGDFAGAKGVILFKDDVVNLKFDYRGHISLASPGVQDAASVREAAKLLEAATRSGC